LSLDSIAGKVLRFQQDGKGEEKEKINIEKERGFIAHLLASINYCIALAARRHSSPSSVHAVVYHP